eukprot:2124754-Rhodomonas_salina.3
MLWRSASTHHSKPHGANGAVVDTVQEKYLIGAATPGGAVCPCVARDVQRGPSLHLLVCIYHAGTVCPHNDEGLSVDCKHGAAMRLANSVDRHETWHFSQEANSCAQP